MNGTELNGESYNDDRMFILYLCKCTVQFNDNVKTTTIHHQLAPENHRWGVVTYRNVPSYPAVRVDCFDSEDEAIAYVRNIEPQVPLISLGSKQPSNPLPYDQFVSWKKGNNLKEYDYKNQYLYGGSNPKEVLVSKI